MRHTDCAVTWNRGPRGLLAPPLAPTLATSGPLTQTPSLPQVPLSLELGQPKPPEAQPSEHPFPTHTPEITLCPPWGGCPSLATWGAPLSLCAPLPLSVQLGLDQMDPQSSSRQDSPGGVGQDPLPESPGGP